MHQARGETDLTVEPVGTGRHAKLWPKDFEGDLPVAVQVAREVDDRHAAGTQLTLDLIAVGQAATKGVDWIRGVA
jgi:hypothetical protein